MPKHVDKLRTLLAQLDCKFSFIGIYWHMYETRNSAELVHEYCISGYNKFSTPTESSAGGVSLYVSDSFSRVPRNDLNHSCYLASNLEYAFVKVNLPNRTNIIVSVHVYPISNSQSKRKLVIHRVPQGSVLEPLLFWIFQTLQLNYFQGLLFIISYSQFLKGNENNKNSEWPHCRETFEFTIGLCKSILC